MTKAQKNGGSPPLASWVRMAVTVGAFTAAPAAAQCPDQWYPIFGVPPGTSGQCRAATLWDPDGAGPQRAQPVVGGEFGLAGGISAARIARFDGDMWLPLGSGSGNGVSDGVWALTTWDPDGSGPQPAQLIAGGNFTASGSTTLNRVARFDGSAWQPLDTGFAGNVVIGVHSLVAWDPDGAGPLPERLIAGGNFSTTTGGTVVNRVAIWDGAAWQPLGNGFVNGDTTALAVYDPDGSGPLTPRLVAGGDWTLSGATAVNRVAWWDGTAWQPLGPGFNSRVAGLTAWDADGPGPQAEQIVATGDFLMSAATNVTHIARWDGSAWQPLGAGVGSSSNCINTWDPDGAGPLTPEVVVAGSFSFAGGLGVQRIARWNGSVWQGFGTGIPSATVYALTNWDPDASGPLVASPIAVGQFGAAGARAVLNIARWQGDDWRPMGNGLFGPVTGQVTALTTWDADGPGTGIAQLVAGGSFTIASGKTVDRIALWDGAEWQALATGLDAGVLDVTTWDPDGGGPLNDEIIAVGGFQMAGTTVVNCVARWNGTQWQAFGTGINGVVDSVTILDLDGPGGNAGTIILGGNFTEATGAPGNYVAMWNPAAPGWQRMSDGFIAPVYTVQTFSPTGNPADTRVYAGGQFGLGGAPPFAFVAKWNGAAWEEMGHGTTHYVYSLAQWNPAPPAAPRLLLGGAFTHVLNADNTSFVSYRVAAWTGSAWSDAPFEPGLAGVAYALTEWDFDGDGPLAPQIVAGGNFDRTINDFTPRLSNIAYWDGNSWESLGEGTNELGPVFALTPWDPDGPGPQRSLLVAGGNFAIAGGLPGAFISAAGVCTTPDCPGDVDADQQVTLSDLAQLLAHFGTPGGATLADGDLDGDGDVDLGDLALLLANFGTSCP